MSFGAYLTIVSFFYKEAQSLREAFMNKGFHGENKNKSLHLFNNNKVCRSEVRVNLNLRVHVDLFTRGV